MEKITTIKIDKELHEKAVKKAKSLGLNLSAYIRFLLINEINEGENK